MKHGHAAAERAELRGYLQLRVEGFVDPERPLPKWTELDRDAVRELVCEFQRLEQAYDLAVERLTANALPVPWPQDAEEDEPLSAWMLEPQPSVPFVQAQRKWWQVWRKRP